jgi:hypothetical protein
MIMLVMIVRENGTLSMKLKLTSGDARLVRQSGTSDRLMTIKIATKLLERT